MVPNDDIVPGMRPVPHRHQKPKREWPLLVAICVVALFAIPAISITAYHLTRDYLQTHYIGPDPVIVGPPSPTATPTGPSHPGHRRPREWQPTGPRHYPVIVAPGQSPGTVAVYTPRPTQPAPLPSTPAPGPSSPVPSPTTPVPSPSPTSPAPSPTTVSPSPSPTEPGAASPTESPLTSPEPARAKRLPRSGSAERSRPVKSARPYPKRKEMAQ
jgi:hypothetical protein